MRPGQNKRMRGRPNNNGGGHRKGPNPLTRSYESNGPDVKIRGNAHHVAEKYLQLARDAQSSGDPVSAESYLQHAEHYFRLIASAQAAQAGLNRQPDAVDDVDDGEEDALPDRFASPQAPAPFVPQPQQQPYGGERQAYGQGNGQGERQPYNDRQGQGGQPYGGGNGERPQYGDRNGYNRQDRNGYNRQDRGAERRPYRDNNGGSNGGGEIRADDRGGDRPYGDRQSRRERYSRENGQDRPYGDRGFDRSREQPAPEQVRDFGAGDQPRVEPAFEPQTDYAAPEPASRPEAAPVYEPAPEPAAQAAEPLTRAEAPAPRRRERPAPVVSDEAPGLPSFITAPARAAPPNEPAAADGEPSLTTSTAFPGDDAAEAPKFPRRRRRTTRATAAAAEGDAPDAPQPAASD